MTNVRDTPVDIRLADCPEDAAAAAPLFDAYRVFYRQRSDVEASHRFLLELREKNETVLYLASIDGCVAGFVHLFPSFDSARMRRFWILNDLFVDPAHRRAGVARMLMQRAEVHAREHGAVGLTLSTAIDNLGAQALYRSEGYVRDDAFYVFNKDV